MLCTPGHLLNFNANAAKVLSLSASAAVDINVLTGGQSNNPAHWSAGLATMQTALDTANPDGTNTIVVGSNGGSFLTKTAYDASGLTNDEYWVDDTDPSSANWTAGPMATDMATAVTAASLAATDIGIFTWSHGEADAPYMPATVTKQRYYDAMAWLFDWVLSVYTNVTKIGIIPIPGRTNAANGLQLVREANLEIAAARADTYYGPEMYNNSSYLDTVHLTNDASGYGVSGTKAGYFVASLAGITVTNSIGPVVSSATVSGNTITVNVTHDGGTTLNSYAGSPVTITPVSPSSSGYIFEVYDNDGNKVTLSSVQVTGASTVTITLPIEYVEDLTLYVGYGSLSTVDRDAGVVEDNNGYALRGYTVVKALTFANLTSPLGLFSAERDPNNTGNPRFYNNSAAAGADVWTNLGTLGNAYRHGSLPIPTWLADASATISGAAAIPAVYSDGTDGIKLLIDHLMTTADDFTVICYLMPDTGITDSVGGARNSFFNFAGVGTNTTHGAIANSKTNARDVDRYIKGVGGSFSGGASCPDGVYIIQREGNTGRYMQSGNSSWSTVDVTSGTSVIDSISGTPVMALFNDTDVPTGTSGDSATGAMPLVLITDSVFSEAQTLHIMAAMENVVAQGAGYTLGITP